MATLQDIGVSAFINIVSAFAFLLAFALLRIQPINDRVYFPKWYITGSRGSPSRSANFVKNFVNLDFRTYITFLNWMPQALMMNEEKIIAHAGLDSAVFLRIYTLGLKIFLPTAIVAILVLIPINVSSGMLFFLRKELVFSDIDKLSISNVQPQSERFFIHIGMEYLFTLWTCYMLYKEYGEVALMRLNYLATQSARPEQFTVLVKNVPHVHGQSVSDTVENFFKENHPEHYLCHQPVYNANRYAKFARRKHRLQNWMDYNKRMFERHPNKKPDTRSGFLGICGKKVDAIDFYEKEIKKIERRMTLERQRILKEPKSTLPVSFVSFNSRWGAAVCAQTQQSRNPTLWLTNWAPEPHDVYWKNLSISFFSLSIRKLVISLSVFALIFCYMVPIAFVQSLANLDGLERVAPFLRSVIERKYIKSFLQGFLPGLALKIFLYILPTVLMIMSKIEGHVAVSLLERKAASKYYYFMLVNVFLGSIITGTAFEQLHSFLHQSPTQIPRTIGVSIPMKATFFITYIMVDGWAAIASEILRLKPLIIFHLKNLFLVKTERDKERAMDPGSINFPETIPSLQFYFLIGAVYAVVTPILLPFILIFFGLAYFVYRHQIINVYNQQYESVAAFWPHVHTRIIASLLISQLLLLGLLSTKEAANSTPLLFILPIFTLSFHVYCKNRFEPAFRRYPLEEAMVKDRKEPSAEADINLTSLLDDAYLHPVFDSVDVDKVGPSDPVTMVDKNKQVSGRPSRKKIKPPVRPPLSEVGPTIEDPHHSNVVDTTEEQHNPPYLSDYSYDFEAIHTFRQCDRPEAYLSTTSSPHYHYHDFGYDPKDMGAHEDVQHS